MVDDQYLVDFDGVILDSQERFMRDMKDNRDLYAWIEYLSSIEWHRFLRECQPIDDSLDVLRELQRLKKLKGILTRIHAFLEGKEKCLYMRESGILVPVLYVLPEQKKSQVITPNKGLTLVDDDPNNCQDWELAGGTALRFDPHYSGDDKKTIKSLKQLL
jgi:hypothetical protein